MDIEERISKALKKLPIYLQKVLTRQYGLKGELPKSLKEIAKEDDTTLQQVKELDAEALRALMYGYKKLEH